MADGFLVSNTLLGEIDCENPMLSTAILLAVFLAAIVLSVVLWASFLRLGLRWAKVPEVTWRRVAAATLIVFAIQLVLNVAFGFIPLDSVAAAGLVFLAALASAVLVPCLVVMRLFRINFVRSLQAWLPTLLSTAAMALLALLVVRPFVFEAFVSPTNAMAPTLLGTHWRNTCPECGGPNYCSPQEDFPGYGYGFELPEARMICENFHVVENADAAGPALPGDRFLTAKFLAPRRWDVIVFRYPAEPSTLYLMRLVGLPGEEIHIANGAVHANGQRLTPPEPLHGIEYVTEFPGGWSVDWGSHERPAKLGDDEFFVLGDFSPQSKDSRLWREGASGHNPYAVPASHIQGVVTHIYWPPGRWRILR